MEFSGTWGSSRKTPFFFHLFQYINLCPPRIHFSKVCPKSQQISVPAGWARDQSNPCKSLDSSFESSSLPFPKGAVPADRLLLSNDEATSPEKRGCLSHRQAIPRLLGLIQNQLKYMESPSTDSKKVWIRPKHQSQHHKLCLEANTRPSTSPSAEVSCAYSEIPDLLSRMLPSAGSSFPRGFSSSYCIAVPESSCDKNMDNSTKIHSHKGGSQPSLPGRDGGGKKDKNQQTNKVSIHKEWRLCAKQWKNLYSPTTKWSKMMTQWLQCFNQQDKSSLLFLCIFQSMESYCLINPLEWIPDN